jgi:hypothetical protein
MNTIAITASTNTILAIDLGKYKSVACVYDQAMGEMSFTTCETTRSELRKLLDLPRRRGALFGGAGSQPQLIHFLTRLWTLTKVSEPAGLLNSVGRFFPSSSKQTFSVSPSIS